MHKVNSGWL